MNIKKHLTEIALQNNILNKSMQFPDCEIDLQKIKVIMVNEVVPKNPDDWFYSEAPDPENRRNALGLFEGAGIPVKSMYDILDLGIYITAALKTPKEGYNPDPDVIKAHLPILESEITMFPNLKIIMLMGDVAIKAFNMIAKAKTKKNVCPTGAAGRRRHWNNENFFGATSVFFHPTL